MEERADHHPIGDEERLESKQVSQRVGEADKTCTVETERWNGVNCDCNGA